MSTPGFSADISLYTTRTQYSATSAWQRGAGVSPQISAGGCWPPCTPGGVQRCCVRTLQFGLVCWSRSCPPWDPCDFLSGAARCHCLGGTWINGSCVYHLV